MQSTHSVVYVSNADSRAIWVLHLNEVNGWLSVVQRVTLSGTVMPLAVSPDRLHLYASLRSEPYSVSTFDIALGSGELAHVETVPLADNMAYISTDRTGRYLFGASYFGNKISVNGIRPDGRVNAEPLHVIPTGKNAHCILTDLSNRYLFVSNLGDDVILQYRFDERSGAVTPNEPGSVTTRKGAGPRHFVFHPDGRYVFGTNELDGTVNTYRLNASGTLTLLGSASLMPPGYEGGSPSAADLHLTPDGAFLYASERTSSTIAPFRVARDGDDAGGRGGGPLTLIGNYPTELQPRGFNIDPEGKYLLAAGQKSNGLTTYKINQKTGVLRKLSTLTVGKNPNWVETFTPGGRVTGTPSNNLPIASAP